MAKRKVDGSLVHIISGQTVDQEHSFQWKIENFLMIKSLDEGDLLFDQKFSFKPDETGTKWYLRLEDWRTDRGTIGIFLSLERACPHFKAMVNCAFQVIKSDGVVLKRFRVEQKLFTGGVRYGSCSLIPGEDKELKKLLWEDGSLVIKVNLKLSIFKVQRRNGLDVNKELKSFEKRELHQLSQAMTRTIDRGSQPEAGKVVKVVSKDGVEFNANTATLSARSLVFKAMFRERNWREGQGSSGKRGGGGGGGSLILEDLSGKTVKVLLHYLVGGILLREDWKAEDVILELTYAADKYQLDGLSEFLDDVLPEMDFRNMGVLGKLALLTKRLGMKNAEKGLFEKLKESVTDIDQLILDKEGSLLGRD